MGNYYQGRSGASPLVMKIMMSRKKQWKRSEIALLLERLELYVEAGLPVDQALRMSLKEGWPGADHVREAAASVESGSSLSRSLTRHLGVSGSIASLIAHGEASGVLGKSLGSARNVLEREDELKKKCLAALAYPTIVGIFASALTIGLVRGIMPQMIPLLKGLRVPLPFLTRTVIFISENILTYGVYVVVLGLIVSVLFKVAYAKWEPFRFACQFAFLRMPLAGRLIRLSALSVFLRTCGSLIESGFSARDAYCNTASSVPLGPLRRDLLSRAGEIDRGSTLGSALSIRGMPHHVMPLALAGESSGTLGPSLVRASDIIDRDIEHGLKRLAALVEPILMIGIGCLVGAIALSIMLPIYDVSKALQK